MDALYAAWLAAPHKTATLRAVTEHFRDQLPSGTCLGKPCRKHGHTWNGTPWCIRKRNHCAICHPIQQLLDPVERRQRKIHRERRRRERMIAQGLSSRDGTPRKRGVPTQLNRSIRAAGRCPTVAQLVDAEQRRYWREHPLHYNEYRKQLFKWRYFVDPVFREQQIKKSNNWRKNNPEKKREQARRWYQANRGKALEAAKAWHKRNPRPRRPMSDEAKQRLAEWRASKPERDKLARKAREHRRSERCRKARGLFPVRGKDLEARFDQFKMKCAYCGCSCSPTLDHFIPIAKGGTHALGNLIPACHDCNSRKRDLDPELWYRAQPFFTEQRWRTILRILGKQRAPVGQLSLA